MARDLDLRDFSESRTSAERRKELDGLVAAASSEAGLLGVDLPQFAVDQVDPTTNNPAVITFAPPPPRDPTQRLEPALGLVADEPTDFVGRALEVVGSIGAPLGLAPGQPAEFAADLSVHETTSGARTVHLEQQYKGIPIFQAAKAVRFGPDGELSALVGRTVTVDEDRDPVPKLTAEEAVMAAARFVATPDEDEQDGVELTDEFGTPVPSSTVDLADFHPRVLARFLNRAEQPTVLDSGPFHDQLHSNLVWFALDVTDLRLAWETVLTLPGAVDQYRVLVDANSGETLYARQLIQSARATANVFPVNGGQPRQSLSLPVPVNAYGVPIPQDLPSGFPSDWVDADSTAGNSTFARFGDSDRVVQGKNVGGVVTFNPASPKSDEQAVLNAFVTCCLMHDFFYLLGFREASGNFQRTNARPGGAAGDRVDVRVYPGPVPRTASMLTPVDGTSPIMKLGLVTSTGNHTAMDATVVAHEFTHGVTNRLVGGPSNVNALDAPQCRAMGEGWGDYIACTLIGTSVVGAWLVNKPGGIRAFAYDKFPSQTDNFGQLGKGRYTQEHNAGEIWCAALLEMNRRIGDSVGVQLVVDALKLAPANPSLLDMRDAILAALDFKGRAGQIPQAEVAKLRGGIWQAFAKFGMGSRAASNGPFLAGITADFTVPGQTTPITTSAPAGPSASGHVFGLEGSVVRAATPEDASVEIPDAEPEGVTSVLAVSETGVVATIRVSVDIEHPAIEQLRITLRSPQGTSAILHEQAPASADLVHTYTADDTPALGGLAGEQMQGDWSLIVADLVESSTGSLRGWSLEADLESEAQTATAALEARPGVAIPDNNPDGVLSTILVQEDALAGFISLSVDITHPAPADLVIELIAPSGRSAIVQENAQSKEPNLVATFDSRSNERLASLLGEPIRGTWTLRVSDRVLKDTGTFNAWSLVAQAPEEPTAAGLTTAAPALEFTEGASGHDLHLHFHSAEAAERFFAAFSDWLDSARGEPGPDA